MDQSSLSGLYCVMLNYFFRRCQTRSSVGILDRASWSGIIKAACISLPIFSESNMIRFQARPRRVKLCLSRTSGPVQRTGLVQNSGQYTYPCTIGHILQEERILISIIHIFQSSASFVKCSYPAFTMSGVYVQGHGSVSAASAMPRSLSKANAPRRSTSQ